MKKQIKFPFLPRLTGVVESYYLQSSEGTRKNISKLSFSLMFTVLVCGSILAASFCEFWLNRNYYWMPLILIGTGLFYYILDITLIFGDHKSKHLKYFRIFIALVLGLFNSFLLDYYFFRSDIDAARKSEITEKQKEIENQYASLISENNQKKTILLKDIDDLEQKLSGRLDSLDAEATGMGGSKKRGLATVWNAKYRSYKDDSTRTSNLVLQKQKEITHLDSTTDAMNLVAQEKIADVADDVSLGINKSLELLHKTIFSEGKVTNMTMAILIFVVSIFFELIPLIAKWFFDISDYFRIIEVHKEACLTNTQIRMQNLISIEAAKLMHENTRASAELLTEHHVLLLQNELDAKRMLMHQTEDYLNEVQQTEKRWQKKYPVAFNTKLKPVIDSAYNIFLQNNYKTSQN